MGQAEGRTERRAGASAAMAEAVDITSPPFLVLTIG